MEGDKEMKAWDAIARYMQSFDDADGDGIANVSEYYATTHDRKVVDDSKNILDLVKKPNKFTAIIVCIGLIIIIIIVLVVSLIRKIVRKSRKKKIYITQIGEMYTLYKKYIFMKITCNNLCNML